MARNLSYFLISISRPQIGILDNPNDFAQYYFANKDNHTMKLAFFMPEDTLFDLNAQCKCRARVLSECLFTIQIGLSTYRNHFLFDILEKVMEKFIPMGIVQHLFEFYMWIHNRPDISDDSKRPQVFCVSDLSFGFILWLIACGISTAGYFLEIIMFKLKKRAKTLSGLVLFIVLLWERMQHYRM